MLLARLKQLEEALRQILELADEHDQVSADDTLMRVADLADKALAL